MRYSIIVFSLVGDTDITVTPAPWSSAIGEGDTIKLNQGNLNKYTLNAVDEDGVRWYSLSQGSYNLLLIPETHQYYNSGMILHHFNRNEYEGSQEVVEILKAVFRRIKGTLV